MHLQILCDVLAGLHYAHELLDYDGTSLQVVHRDVSPQNVFVTYHGQVKVVDFGVAKAANATVKTAPGTFVGKFSYASPEQVLGSGVDARTDVFAVGVMLWEAIARKPFSEREPTPTACRARVEGLEPRIADVVPTVDPVLARICDRALAVDIDERFASAKELRYALQNYMQLAGVRVEANELGLLMQETFAEERRSLHTRIEQAVRVNGMGEAAVDDLPIFHSGEKVPTAVADLSSLIQVSLEEDEQKLQQSYAHSKVTLVRPNGKRETVLPSVTPQYKSRSPLAWFMALSALVGVSLAILTRTSTMKPKTESKDAFATHTSAPTSAPTTGPLVAADATPKLNLVLPAAQQDVSAVTNEPAEVRASGRIGTSGQELEQREAKHADNTRRDNVVLGNAPRSRGASAPLKAAASEPARGRQASAPNAAHIEEGTDLTFGRRVPLIRIDSENPYQ
jgi:serine/threonine protein kinase